MTKVDRKSFNRIAMGCRSQLVGKALAMGTVGEFPTLPSSFRNLAVSWLTA